MGILSRLRGRGTTTTASSETPPSKEVEPVDADSGLDAGSLGASVLTDGRSDLFDSGPGMSTSGGGAAQSVLVSRSASQRGSFGFDALDEAARAVAAEQGNADDELDVTKMTRAQRKIFRDSMESRLDAYPHLLAIKPTERYVFHSDYYEVDNQVACILAFFHNDEAKDAFPIFWGVDLVPAGLGEGVTTVLFEQVARMSESWVDSHLKTSDDLNKMSANEEKQSGSASSKRKTAKIADDTSTIVGELHDGASYLSVHNRLLVKAPTLEALDVALERIKRLYIDRFTTITAAPYHGEQRQELSTLFSPNKNKRGRGFHYTSTEFAGSYSLVTNGLNDATGEYVGYMRGDVNTSAVLFDVDKYDSLVVCADDTLVDAMGRSRLVDMWGSKISQAALLNNRKVVHLVLNGADLDKMGPPFATMTSRVDMTKGEVNMFEIFGDVKNELSLFPTHLQKITLMTEQAYGADGADSDGSLAIIRGQLQDVLKKFYVDQEMWADNAKVNRDRLRLVGIPHEEVPLLQVFVTYLDTEYLAMKNDTRRDPEMFKAVTVLRLVFKNLLNNNGDLFNEHTSSAIDSVHDSRRVIYDFSGLARRGKGVAMAQLVNIVGFAVESMDRGDTVIIHGAQGIVDPHVQDYLAMQFNYLRERGGRVVYLYDAVEAMLNQENFNRFTRADYTILGPMGTDDVEVYQDLMNQPIPRDLASLVSVNGDPGLSYLRRGMTNVVFQTELLLGRSMIGKTMDANVTHRRPGHTPSGFGTVPEVDKDEASDALLNAQQAIRRKQLSKNSALKKLDQDLARERASASADKEEGAGVRA